MSHLFCGLLTEQLVVASSLTVGFEQMQRVADVSWPALTVQPKPAATTLAGARWWRRWAAGRRRGRRGGLIGPGAAGGGSWRRGWTLAHVIHSINVDQPHAILIFLLCSTAGRVLGALGQWAEPGAITVPIPRAPAVGGGGGVCRRGVSYIVAIRLSHGPRAVEHNLLKKVIGYHGVRVDEGELDAGGRVGEVSNVRTLTAAASQDVSAFL